MHPDGTVAFRVWAPRAEQVELELHGERHSLTPQPRGWHEATVPASHGDDYAFVLDGGEPRPDPASRWQPAGVHGPSRLLNVSRFPWSDDEYTWRPAPLARGVFYELHVGTFTAAGTFAAAAADLTRLRALGVTHVEVMPVNAFNGERGWGYDGVGWWAVHQPYGGPEAFARFVDGCHRAGLGVVLDVVYNHLGPSGNYLPEFGPYLTDRYVTPWGQAVNLDGPGSDEVRAFIVESALAWLADYHLDGLRLDAVHGLIDASAVHLLAELSVAVDRLAGQLQRPLVLIAESDRQDPQTVRPRELGGMGMDAQWSDDLHHALHTALTGESDGYYADYRGLPDVAEAYVRGFVYDGSRYSTYRGRTVGAPLPADVPGHRLVCCLQNHDQVGNRAAGERLAGLVEPALVRVGALLLCASPFTLLLFMGEEYGETNPFCYFTSHPEPALAAAVRKGRRSEFAAFAAFSGEVPDPQDEATFAASRLDRSRADTPAGRARQALWADLLRLRGDHAALGNARRDLVEIVAVDEATLVAVRHDPEGPPVTVAANLDAAERPVRLPPADWTLLLGSDEVQYGGDGRLPVPAGDTVVLPGQSGALWIAGGEGY